MVNAYRQRAGCIIITLEQQVPLTALRLSLQTAEKSGLGTHR